MPVRQRAVDALRPVTIERGYTRHAAGSVLIAFGETRVLCTAMFEDKVPQWLKGNGKGWVTAEYAMLPSATQTRSSRDNNQRGRAQEISRLIGRSLRSVINLQAIGECMITLDCDVIQADGGTRTAAITGAYIALHDALTHSMKSGFLKTSPLTGACAAVSVGIVDGIPLLDLDYSEDVRAEVDMNVVMDNQGRLIEIQGCAEQEPFSRDTLQQMLDMAQSGIQQLLQLQQKALNHG